MYEEKFNSKSERRLSIKKNKEKKWIKHNIGEWGKIHGNNPSKFQKKKIKQQLGLLK